MAVLAVRMIAALLTIGAVYTIGTHGLRVEAQHVSKRSIVLRTVTVGSNPQDAAVDDKTGRVFVTSDAGVSILDARTGTVLRTIRVRGYLGSVFVNEPAGRVFVIDVGSPGGNGGATGSVIVLGAATGAILRRTIVGKTPLALAIDVRTNRAFVSNQDSNTISILDATDGHLMRTVHVGQVPGPIAVDERRGHVFVGDQTDNYIYELNAQSGAVLRKTDMGDSPNAIVVMSRAGRAYVGLPMSNTVSVIDTSRGVVVKQFPIDTPLDLVADELTGRLAAFGYMPGGSGTVSLVDTATDTVVKSVPMARPKAVAFDDATARVFMVDVSGVISVRDARTGLGLQTARAGALPQTIVIDTKTARAFVLSVGMIATTGNRVGSGTVTVLDATA